jgi:2-hydroxy-3-oxopropionate reductase
MVKKVGFIGLGMMGNPMSKSLIKAGFELIVWNRTPFKMEEIVKLGAKSAGSAKAVAEKSDVTITMLAGPPDVEEVILGKDGVLEGMKPGSVVIDMSTISSEVSMHIAAEVAKKGGHMLDAPVGGSVGVAAAGALTIQVGGDERIFENHRDIFAAMGKHVYYIGENGMGCYMKLIANTIMGANMAVLGEALCLGAKEGIPVELMMEVLKNSGSHSRILETRGPNIVKGEYKAQFMMKHLFKDMGLALNTAATKAVPMPIAGLVRQIYAQAMADGRAEEDYSAVVATEENISKTVRKR